MRVPGGSPPTGAGAGAARLRAAHRVRLRIEKVRVRIRVHPAPVQSLERPGLKAWVAKMSPPWTQPLDWKAHVRSHVRYDAAVKIK